MPAFAAINRQIPAFDLDRATLTAKPLDLGLGLVVRAKAALAAFTTAVVLWGIHTKKSVDRETHRGYKPAPANESLYSPPIPAPTRNSSTTRHTSGDDKETPP